MSLRKSTPIEKFCKHTGMGDYILWNFFAPCMYIHTRNTYNIRLALNGIPHTRYQLLVWYIYRVAECVHSKELCVWYNKQVKPLVGEKNEDKSLQQEYRLSILEQLTTVALDMVRESPSCLVRWYTLCVCFTPKPDVSTAIEVATVTAYQAKVEGRVRERERTKSIR